MKIFCEICGKEINNISSGYAEHLVKKHKIRNDNRCKINIQTYIKKVKYNG